MAVASITEQAGRTVVALSGEIDMGEAPKVRRALLDSIKKKRDILVDLALVTYIDSSGIAGLIEGLRAARKQKNDLALVSVSQCARRVLKLDRLHRVFIVHADLATALRSANPMLSASSTQNESSTGRMLLRRLRRVACCALSLYLSFVIVSDAGEKSKDAAQPVNLFVDITSNRLADEIDISQKRRLDLAGVPVMVGRAR